MNCDGCECYVKTGETWVPYQETWVKYTDDYVCSKGHDLDCCPDEAPPEERHYTVRSYSHGLSEQDWERADYERERGL